MPNSGLSVAAESTGPAIAVFTRVEDSETRWFQRVTLEDRRLISYEGRASTYRQIGRGAATQNICTIWNGSANVLVDVKRIMFDAYGTAARIITTHPSIVRVSRITAAPTGGTALGKVPVDSALTSDAAVVATGDATADGTNSGTALAATIAAQNYLAQEVVSRNVWISGTAPPAGTYMEVADRMTFFEGERDIVLRQNQGLIVHLASPAAASIPTTDNFIASIDWEEYTLP